jgi:hypothetical protein
MKKMEDFSKSIIKNLDTSTKQHKKYGKPKDPN